MHSRVGVEMAIWKVVRATADAPSDAGFDNLDAALRGHLAEFAGWPG